MVSTHGSVVPLAMFHSFIGHLRCFAAIFLVLIFLGLFCICAILIAFSISVYNHHFAAYLIYKDHGKRGRFICLVDPLRQR